MQQFYQATWNDAEDPQQQAPNFAAAMHAIKTTDWNALADFHHSINLRDAHEAPVILAAGERAVAENKEAILAAVRNFSAACFVARAKRYGSFISQMSDSLLVRLK